MSDKQMCKNCFYSSENSGAGVLCRKNAPIPLNIITTSKYEEAPARWPNCNWYDWCGEWKKDETRNSEP